MPSLCQPLCKFSVTSVGIAVLLGSWAVYRKWRWSRSPLSAIPGPADYDIFFGQFFALIGGKVSKLFIDWAHQYGDMVAFDMTILGTRLLICNASALKRVLLFNMTNYRMPNFLVQLLQGFLGQGLILSQGDAHKRQRKIISDAFRFENISKLAPHFNLQAEKVVSSWLHQIQSSTDGSGSIEVDISKAMHNLTLDIIGWASFGFDFNACSNQHTDLGDAYADAIACSSVSFLNAVTHMWPFRLLPLPGVLRERRAHRRIRAAVDDIIRRRREALRAAAGDEAATARLEGDLLGLMLRAADRGASHESTTVDATAAAAAASSAPPDSSAWAEGSGPCRPAAAACGLSDEEVRNNIITFLMIGHAPTASNLSWTLYLLAKYPAAADRVRYEVRAAAAGGRQLTAGDVEMMPFLNAVLKESLRLFPPVPSTVRVPVNEDCLCEYRIPSGTVISVPIMVLHRHKDLWNRPDEFVPRRFLPGSTIDSDRERHPYKWCPFLAGPRTCIGSRFAQIQVALVVAAIVSRVRLELPPDHPEPHGRQGDLILIPHPYIRLRVSPLSGDCIDSGLGGLGSGSGRWLGRQPSGGYDMSLSASPPVSRLPSIT